MVACEGVVERHQENKGVSTPWALAPSRDAVAGIAAVKFLISERV
ncbi:MAG: hypothetical protein ACJA1Q_002298 [Pseudohongiellaceae bacterium]|jgi:hypothetical protein